MFILRNVLTISVLFFPEKAHWGGMVPREWLSIPLLYYLYFYRGNGYYLGGRFIVDIVEYQIGKSYGWETNTVVKPVTVL